MKFARPLLLAASALAFLISACSQPADLKTPGLEPQFGTKNNDVATNVLIDSTGNVSVLSKESGTKYFPETGTNSIFEKVLLRKYDNNGKLLRSTVLDTTDCSTSDEIDESCRVEYVPRSLTTDASGNTYAAYVNNQVGGFYPDERYGTYVVLKINAAGKVAHRFFVGRIFGYELTSDNIFDAAVDSSGNLYTVSAQNEDFDESQLNIISRYSSDGSLIWQRNSKVGILSSITVDDGGVYVTGSKGFTFLSYGGTTYWTKPGEAAEIVATDVTGIETPYLYVRNLTTIRAFGDLDRQFWSKTQTGLQGMVIVDMTIDRGGNLYLSGKYTASKGNRDAFVRKLDASGKVLWTKTFGTSAYDDAKGIATVTGAGIYVTGETQGALTGQNLGGSDGYLRKLNSSGDPVWTR